MYRSYNQHIFASEIKNDKNSNETSYFTKTQAETITNVLENEEYHEDDSNKNFKTTAGVEESFQRKQEIIYQQ